MSDPTSIPRGTVLAALATLGITDPDDISHVELEPDAVTVWRYARTRTGDRVIESNGTDVARYPVHIPVRNEEPTHA